MISQNEKCECNPQKLKTEREEKLGPNIVGREVFINRRRKRRRKSIPPLDKYDKSEI